MDKFKNHHMPSSSQQGFALLLTLVVVSIVLAIGLSLLTITLKQLTLSATARNSEIAFQAANFGMECMRFYRAQDAVRDDMLEDASDGGAAPTLFCGTSNPYTTPTTNHQNLSTDHPMFNYVYQYLTDIDGNNAMCSEISIYLVDTRSATSEATYTIDEGFDEITCQEGSICTYIFSRGFNRGCGDLNSIYIVQRELTVSY